MLLLSTTCAVQSQKGQYCDFIVCSISVVSGKPAQYNEFLVTYHLVTETKAEMILPETALLLYEVPALLCV